MSERIAQLEANLTRGHAEQDRIRELETQLAWARSELTRLADSHSRKRRDWIWRIAISFVLVGGSSAMVYVVVALASSAGRTATAGTSGPEDVESVAAADLGCPREELRSSSFGERQKVVTGCGKCALYAGPFGWGRVTNPESVKWACGR